MRSYELILIIKGSIAEALRKKVVASVKTMLKDLKITKENEIGQKTLAYKIKKETNGYYFSFIMEGENIPVNFEKRLIENDNVLRHLLLRSK